MVEVLVGGWGRGKKNGRGRGGERGGKVVKGGGDALAFGGGRRRGGGEKELGRRYEWEGERGGGGNHKH